MEQSVTKGDLYEAIAGLKYHLDERLDASGERLAESRRDFGQSLREINERLRELNGKVAAQELAIANGAQKQRELERRFFRRRTDQDHAAGDLLPAITKGDIKRVGVGLGLVVALIQILRYAGDLAIAFGKMVVHSGAK
jgi:hypothetical protein